MACPSDSENSGIAIIPANIHIIKLKYGMDEAGSFRDLIIATKKKPPTVANAKRIMKKVKTVLSVIANTEYYY